MSKFEEDFRGPFDVFGHNNANGPQQQDRRNVKRGNEKPPSDVMVMNEMPLAQRSYAETRAKKSKTVSETNNERGVGSLPEKSPIPPKNIGSESRNMDGINVPTNKTRIETILRDEGQGAKMSLLKWNPAFTESEAFEAFCPSRMDELLKEALQLEAHLKNQKEQLKNRLTHLSQTLKIQMK
ncbi:hypothetical protein QZH41_008541 [Actinostola sp. cb2023]|nr:hypothetical protein QZH41_008541 [Actinostola sp. cb2023]